MHIVTFYACEILNENGKSQYAFHKYADQSGPSLWTQVGQTMKAGKEFYRGHGPDAVNTVKISANSSSFSFCVNGRLVGTATDAKPLRSGEVGLLVNLKGTELAFSHLLIMQLYIFLCGQLFSTESNLSYQSALRGIRSLRVGEPFSRERMLSF
jgi:hypothetical protein